ncbi:phage tail tape measure protein [Yersinia pseudotuberculosis]|uniref:phage tail tape measure protein n=1 Tax=Yersinia pseudotuberculosis TaxID=633 RepID=UPI0038B4B7ED
MARNLQLALTLFAKDTASKVLRKTMQDTINQSKSVAKADNQLGKSQKQSADTAIRSSKSLQSEWQRASNARSTLGIRSERDIQREIQLTQAAYNRLTRTGTLSANEQSRAFASMSERVSKLRGELSGASQSLSRFERAKGIGSNAMAIAGGVAAMGAVLAQPVRNQMSYDSRVAMMANTAYAERGVEGRIEGKKELSGAIKNAVTIGGGTKESAADTLDKLLASGAVDMDSAKTLLPVIQKYATATGADPTDLANIVISLKRSFGIQNKDVEKALNMSIVGGQEGSYELADMAKALPEQLALAKSLGMSGLDDYATLLGVNQGAATTAGTSSQAGTNVINLLAKINSKDAARAAARVEYNGKGIDLPGSLAAAKEKGINPIDAFMGIVDKVVANDPAYQKLEAKLKTAKGEDRKQVLESMSKILEGSAIGSIIADQQALLGLLGYRGNKEYVQGVIKKSNEQRELRPGEGAGDINFAVISDTPDFKTDQLKNVRDFAEMDSIKPLSDVLGRLSKELTDYAEQYPGLTVAVSGATTGIKALAAGAAAVAGIRILTGGGIPGISKKGGSFNPTDILSGDNSNSGVVPVYVTNWQDIGEKNKLVDAFKDLPGAVGKFASYVNVVTALKESFDERRKRNQKEADEKGVNVGEYLISKRANQKPLFDFDPASWWSKPSTIGGKDAASAGVPEYMRPQQKQYPYMPIQIKATLELDGKVLAESTNEVNSSQANRGPTGSP